jgi:hypothetical protein
MKPGWQVGWILFAAVMVWGECVGDVPRLLLPHHTTPAHFVVAVANVTAALGLVFYAFRYNRSRAFWRLFAPLYALFVAGEVGGSFVALTQIVTGLIALGKDAPLAVLGGMVVMLPIAAMAVFTMIALFRLGDWIGPTRRPIGARPQQLSLPI